MYNQKRIEWWLGRSQSPEYQSAYDTIAQAAPQGLSTYLDAACGSAEVLGRIHAPHRIGTDLSRVMLEHACNRIGGEIVPQITPDAIPSLAFVNESVMYSRLPKELADVTIFSFPETGTLTARGTDSAELVEWWAKNIEPVAEGTEALVLTTMRPCKTLSSLTKPGGTIIFTQYDISNSTPTYDADILEFTTALWGHFDVHVQSQQFHENPAVWADTVDSNTGMEPPTHAKKGYRTYTMRKT